jgi:uncharacterized protein YbjQ (UPF0145 family)
VIVTTTSNLQGQHIDAWIGIVSGETLVATSFVKDVVSGVRDRIGGRIVAGRYTPQHLGPLERDLRRGREAAMAELQTHARNQGADAVIGVTIEYRPVGAPGMVMVSASGTAVRLRQAA